MKPVLLAEPSTRKRLLLKSMLGNSKVSFLVLLFFVLMVVAYYLGTTRSFKTGHPVNVQANTMIQYFNHKRGTNEGSGPAQKPTEHEKSFIEQVITNRTSSENSDKEIEQEQKPTERHKSVIEQVITNRTWREESDTKTKQIQGQTVRQKSFIEQVISNRSESEKVTTETERTQRPTTHPVESDLVLDFRRYLQKILTDLTLNEDGTKTPDRPAKETVGREMKRDRERDEATKTETKKLVISDKNVYHKTESSQSYIQQVLRDRGLDKTRRTEIPETNAGRTASVSVDKDAGANAAEKKGLPTVKSPTSAQAKSDDNSLSKPNELPLQKPPQQASPGKSKSFDRNSLQPPPLPKPFYEQRASSDITYDKWHRQRLSDMCGKGWQQKYQQLHEEILSGRQEDGYLVYSCPGYRQGCCGYGNRLRALASVFYLAILTGRAFLVDWQIPEPIDRHLKPKGIRWNYTEPIDMCTGPEFRRHYWGSTKSEIREAQGWILQDSSSFARWFTSTNFSTFFEYPVERITTIWYFVEKGVRDNPFLMARAKELQITPLLSRLPPYALIGCAFDFLFTMSDRVDHQLSRLRQNVQRGPVIGIHVRTGDDQFDYYASANDRTWNARNLTRLLRFFECAANVEKNVFRLTEQDAAAVKWFVATDNPGVKTLARKRFPDKVVTSDLPILHLDILLNSTLSNVTANCHYTDSSNTTLVCTDVEPFNRTVYCANRTNDTLSNTTVFNATEGIISMLVDHFLLAESDFLVLCDSSFGSAAVGLSMRGSASYTFGDRGCADVKLARRYRRLQFFRK